MVKRPIFTAEHIGLWSADLDDRPAPASELEWPDFPDVLAFRAQALSAGVTLRLRCRDGAIRDLRMNPVVARELAAWILHAGTKAGWLDPGSGQVIPPPPVDHDA